MTSHKIWDVVEVIWDDAQYDASFDAPVDEDSLGKCHLALVHSVGYYIQSSADSITLGSSRGPRNNSARFLLTIPRAGIKNIRTVRRATKEGS